MILYISSFLTNHGLVPPVAEQLVEKFNQHVTISSQETFNTKKLTFYSNIERVANSFRKTYK